MSSCFSAPFRNDVVMALKKLTLAQGFINDVYLLILRSFVKEFHWNIIGGILSMPSLLLL
jgi:hypothetical protein